MRDLMHYKGWGGSVWVGEEVDLGYRKIASGLKAMGYTPYLKSARCLYRQSLASIYSREMCFWVFPVCDGPSGPASLLVLC
jgi:hypothetical protein